LRAIINYIIIICTGSCALKRADACVHTFFHIRSHLIRTSTREVNYRNQNRRAVYEIADIFSSTVMSRARKLISDYAFSCSRRHRGRLCGSGVGQGSVDGIID